MRKSKTLIKAERRAQRKRPRMVVQGASVKRIQRIMMSHRNHSRHQPIN